MGEDGGEGREGVRSQVGGCEELEQEVKVGYCECGIIVFVGGFHWLFAIAVDGRVAIVLIVDLDLSLRQIVFVSFAW